MIECNKPYEVDCITRQPPHEPENIAGSNYYVDRSVVFFQRDIMCALGVLLPKGVSVGAALRGEAGTPEIRFRPGVYARERLVHLLNVIGEYKLYEYHIGTTRLTAKKLQVLLTLLRDDDWEIGYEKDDQAYEDIRWRWHSGQSSFIKPVQVYLTKDWKDPLLDPFDPFKDGECAFKDK